MKKNDKFFQKERLKEAIDARGINQADLSRMLGLTRPSVNQYLSGKQIPSLETVFKLSSILEVPHTYFFKQPQPSLVNSRINFRSLASAKKIEKNACRQKFEWLGWLIETITSNIEFLKPNLPTVNLPFDPDKDRDAFIEEVAEECRQIWKMGNGPIGNLLGFMELNGIVISKAYLGYEQIDAFSAWVKDYPVIMLGSDKSSAVRSRFDAAHELGHLILHRNIDKERADTDKYYHKKLEDEANYFASALLLPRDTFKNEVYFVSFRNLQVLKSRWLVSMAAMIRRCYQLGIIDENEYTRLNIELGKRGFKRQEPLDDEIQFERPVLFQKAMDLLLDRGILNIHDLEARLDLSARDIEHLLCLPDNYFSDKRKHAQVISLRLKRDE